MERDVVVVGAGVAGLSVAERLASAGVSVALVHSGALGGTAPGVEWIEDYPSLSDRRNGAEVAAQLIQAAEVAGVQFIESTVEELEVYSNCVALALPGHDALMAGHAVLATGMRNRLLDEADDLSRFEGRGLIGCALCDGTFYANEDVAVCGGGRSGALDALFLASHCRTVHLIEQGDALRCGGELEARIRAAPNIQVRLNSHAESVVGNGGISALSVREASGGHSELAVAGLSIQVGRTPNTEFLRGVLPLDERGRIHVDARLRTSVPNIYAVGDVRSESRETVAGALSDAQAVAEALLKAR